MPRILQRRMLLLLGVLSLCLLALPQAALGCEICKYTFFLGYSPCRAVTQDEVGSTICRDYYDAIAGFSCEESGTFCQNIIVGGGGGPGGSGGTGSGSSCQTSGACPAQCFSCSSGGGGKPAV
jgi:hypothetical protein